MTRRPDKLLLVAGLIVSVSCRTDCGRETVCRPVAGARSTKGIYRERLQAVRIDDKGIFVDFKVADSFFSARGPVPSEDGVVVLTNQSGEGNDDHISVTIERGTPRRVSYRTLSCDGGFMRGICQGPGSGDNVDVVEQVSCK
jgi:hypothetical protein